MGLTTAYLNHSYIVPHLLGKGLVRNSADYIRTKNNLEVYVRALQKIHTPLSEMVKLVRTYEPLGGEQ